MNTMKNYLTPLVISIFTIIGCQKSSEKKELLPIAEFGKSMPIGLSVNSENRVFVSFPNYNGSGDLALAEIKEGNPQPYPDEEWNTKLNDDRHFFRVQDIYVDAEDFLWVLDSQPGLAGNIFADGTGATEGYFKLVKINTKTNQVEDTFLFEDLDKSKSALNDVRVDVEKNLAYLSDPGLAAIVVLDLPSKKSRTVLAETPYTLAEPITLEYDGIKMQDQKGNPFSSNINSIALSPDFKYFYFKPINKENLYRIETQHLAQEGLTDADLSTKVEDLGKVGITHGMVADARGHVYFASSEDYSIRYIQSDGTLKTLIADPNLIWPDSFGVGPDGYLYFTCAQLQRLPQWNNDVDRTVYPYQAFKVELP